MTKIKMCGLSRLCDIEWANALKPDYIGFVFAKKSRRYVSPDNALLLKALLDPAIKAVGVFVNEPAANIASLLDRGIIDIAQLHGSETEDDIFALRRLTSAPIIKAFRIETAVDIEAANNSTADLVLLDSGSGGTGKVFDWSLVSGMRRPYLLAGGLSTENADSAVRKLHPYGIDVSSGIESNGFKDKDKMVAISWLIRKENDS